MGGQRGAESGEAGGVEDAFDHGVTLLAHAPGVVVYVEERGRLIHVATSRVHCSMVLHPGRETSS
jgi:hypothetical protein